MSDEYKEVMIVWIAGVFIFLVFTGIMIFILLYYQKNRFQQARRIVELESAMQQELLKVQLETQEETFQQIAQELHDNVGQLLSSTKILLVITERNLPEPPPATLLTATRTLSKAMEDMRLLTKSLSGNWLDQFDLVKNVENELNRLKEARHLKTTFHAGNWPADISATTELMLFRIIQEALQNCLKHAEASAIEVQLSGAEPGLVMKVTDNGIGFSQDAHGRGMGIMNMRNRIRLLGGEMHLKSEPGMGTSITIQIPQT